jgi:hypothetical protein
MGRSTRLVRSVRSDECGMDARAGALVLCKPWICFTAKPKKKEPTIFQVPEI